MPDSNIFSRSLLGLACSVALTTVNPSAQASGFAVPELNPAGLAVSNALVANPKMQAAIAYNPAAMSFHDGKSLSLATILVKPDLAVDTGSGSVDSGGNDLVAIPSVTAHATLSDKWAIGIAVNAPFGLETEWPAGTYDSQYPMYDDLDPNSTKPNIPTQSKLEIVAFSPSVAHKVNENVSIAGGIDVYWAKTVILNSSVNTLAPLGSDPTIGLEGDGRGVGLNLGLMVNQGAWSFGGSYHSEAKLPIKGSINSPNGSANVNADLKIPSRLQLGVRHQTTEKLGIEFDFTRTGWSSFDQLKVNEERYDQNVVTSTNNWENANAFRLGATYDITGATQLRVGFTLDKTPQGETFFSPRIPDADRQLFSMGIGHTLNNGWSIDAGYMYVKFDDRSVDIDPGFSHPAPLDEETNGTSAVNGNYEASVHLFGLGLTKKFM
ncbi:MAG: outer membrane protein transport protein [Candidatus Thiodiazotropha sp.]